MKARATTKQRERNPDACLTDLTNKLLTSSWGFTTPSATPGHLRTDRTFTPGGKASHQNTSKTLARVEFYTQSTPAHRSRQKPTIHRAHLHKDLDRNLQYTGHTSTKIQTETNNTQGTPPHGSRQKPTIHRAHLHTDLDRNKQYTRHTSTQIQTETYNTQGTLRLHKDLDRNKQYTRHTCTKIQTETYNTQGNLHKDLDINKQYTGHTCTKSIHRAHLNKNLDRNRQYTRHIDLHKDLDRNLQYTGTLTSTKIQTETYNTHGTLTFTKIQTETYNTQGTPAQRPRQKPTNIQSPPAQKSRQKPTIHSYGTLTCTKMRTVLERVLLPPQQLPSSCATMSSMKRSSESVMSEVSVSRPDSAWMLNFWQFWEPASRHDRQAHKKLPVLLQSESLLLLFIVLIPSP